MLFHHLTNDILHQIDLANGAESPIGTVRGPISTRGDVEWVRNTATTRSPSSNLQENSVHRPNWLRFHEPSKGGFLEEFGRERR